MDDPHLGPPLAREDGRLRLHGVPASLVRWLDEQLRALALADGAIECRVPVTIASETLERAGFAAAFPGGASMLAPDAARRPYGLCPAVCYHAYQWLQGSRLTAPLTLTAAQTCFREADRAAASASRLWEFTMREVIVVGSPGWVSSRCDEWAHTAEHFAARLELDAALEPATDLFFGPAARGRQLLQQIKELKRELRMPAGDERVAVASINRHETFFSSRFDIRLADGRDAHSACVAFGLERWALAFLAQRGTAAAALLVG